MTVEPQPEFYDQDKDPLTPPEYIIIRYKVHTFFSVLAFLIAVFALVCALVAINSVPDQGPRGPQGRPGIQGEPGPRGPQGNPGVSRFP